MVLITPEDQGHFLILVLLWLKKSLFSELLITTPKKSFVVVTYYYPNEVFCPTYLLQPEKSLLL